MPKKCPNCLNKSAVPIMYGMLAVEAFEDVDTGKIVLGGCCVSDQSPKWHCMNCGHEFGKYLDIDLPDTQK